MDEIAWIEFETTGSRVRVYLHGEFGVRTSATRGVKV